MNPRVKIDRPPAAENWARMQHPEIHQTARQMFNFLRGAPIWNYNVGRSIVKYRIEDRIPIEDAHKIISRSGSSIGRPFNRDLVDAFFDFEKNNPIDGIRGFDDYTEAFPLSRSVRIPIKPLTVIRENGSFTPLFLCPWSKLSFDSYQSSLFMTILEKAIFTHSDFENSEGKIMFFPKVLIGNNEKARKPVIWKRGDFPLLSDKELSEQISVFFESKELALGLYQDFLRKKANER